MESVPLSPQIVFTSHPAPREAAMEAYHHFNQDDDFTKKMRDQIQRDKEENEGEMDEKQKLFDQMVQEEMSKMEEYFLNETQTENVTGTEQRRHGHHISPKSINNSNGQNNNNSIDAKYQQESHMSSHPGDLFAPVSNSSRLGIDGVSYQSHQIPKSNEMKSYVDDLHKVGSNNHIPDNLSDVTSQPSISDYDLVGQVRHTRNIQNTGVDEMNQNQGLGIGMSDYAEQQRRRQAKQDYARKLDQDKISPILEKEYVPKRNPRTIPDASDASLGSSSFFRQEHAPVSAEEAAIQKRQAQLAYMESIKAAADAPPITSSRSSAIDARNARIQEEQVYGKGLGDDSTVLSVTSIGEKEIPPQSARETRRKQQLEYAQQLQNQIQQSQSLAEIEPSRSRPPSGTVALQSQMGLPTPPDDAFVIGSEHTSPMRQQRMQKQRQIGDELRSQISRNESVRRDRNRDPREIPDDPFRPRSNTNANGGAIAARAQRLMEEESLSGLSLGSGSGLLSAFGESGDAERSRLQERTKMMTMSDMQMQAQEYARVQASARRMGSAQPQVSSTPTGNRGAIYSDMVAVAVPNVGATPGAVGSLQMDVEKRRQAQRQYMMQLQQDSATKPIPVERVTLRKKSNLDEDDLTLSPNAYAASVEEGKLRKQKIDKQRFYHDQLLNDSTVQGVEGLAVQDYNREARQTQHQHRARYRQQMLNPQQQGLTIDHSGGQEYMTGGFDPQAVQELGYAFAGSSLPAGMGAAYAKQLKEEAERLAAEAEAKGKATGPHNWNEEIYQQRRQQQNMYAKQLADDARNAQLVMAMPIERSTLIKPEKELSGEVRHSSNKVQEYHAKQTALKKVEEDQWKASLGDLQMGSPFKTQARLDGGHELNRGVRATGYGANRGPNPVQKPYVNEDELYARAARKKSQMDYQKALQETAQLRPIEQSRESWVNEDRTQNGLPGSDSIRAAYKTQYGSFSDERQANAVNYRPELSVQADFQNSFKF